MNTAKHMTKAQWTWKVLWNFEPNYQKTRIGWNKKSSFWRHDQTEVVILAEPEQTPFCNGDAIPLQIVLRLLIMWAPNFFGLSLCWGFEQK